jgi:hypothetical protein
MNASAKVSEPTKIFSKHLLADFYAILRPEDGCNDVPPALLASRLKLRPRHQVRVCTAASACRYESFKSRDVCALSHLGFPHRQRRPDAAWSRKDETTRTHGAPSPTDVTWLGVRF